MIKDASIQEIINGFEELVYSFTDLEAYKQRILYENLQQHEELRQLNLSLAECHTLDCIGQNQQPNATALARTLRLTKGAISKITAKLLGKQLIIAVRLPHNNKEIYYNLTPLGQKIFMLHATLHEQAEALLAQLFSGYSQTEIEFAVKFLSDLRAVVKTTINQGKDAKQPQ